MIDIGKFAKPNLHATDGSFFRFNTSSREEIASELHRFADRIASGDILIQKIQGGQVASVDEYFMQALLIEFAERESAAEHIKEVEDIYDSGNPSFTEPKT